MTADTRDLETVRLAQTIGQHIARSEKYHQDELDRYGFARDVLAELLARMPHTLAECFTFNTMFTGWGTPPATELIIFFRLRDEMEDTSIAFGTIIKAAAALMRIGCEVEPVPQIAATSSGPGLDVEVHGRRNDGMRIKLNFQRLPETDRCRLIEEDIVIPERREKKMRVECDDEPLRVTSGVPSIEAAQERPR